MGCENNVCSRFPITVHTVILTSAMLLVVNLCLPVFHLGGYSKKRAIKKLVTHVESHASAVSLLERAENSAI